MKKWPMLISLTLTYTVFAILLNSVGTVILQVTHHYEITKQHASILEGFKDFPIAIVSFLLASFLPRLGYKTAFKIGLVIVILACFAMPLLPSFFTTKMMFLAVGVSYALMKVSTYATIGLVTDNQKQHASLLNALEGFFMLGVLLGYWLFSLFISDSSAHNKNWLQIYWLLGGLSAINLILLNLTTIPNPPSSSSNSYWQDFRCMLKLIPQPLVLVFILSSFLYVLIEQSIGTWLPTFNNEILQFSRSMSVQAASIFAGSLALGRLIAGVLLQKIHWYFLLSICIAAIGLLILLVLPLTQGIKLQPQMTWQDAPLVLFLLPMIGLFMAPIYPALNSVMLSALPKSQHAAMTGLIVVFSALGGTTGSLITGNLFAIFGGHTAFYLLLLPLVALYYAFYGFRYFSQHPINTSLSSL